MGEKSYVCLFVVLACHEPELDGFSWHSTVLSCAIDKPQQHQEKNSWERQDSNLLGEKQICYLCAMQPQSSKIFGMFFRTKSEFFRTQLSAPVQIFWTRAGEKVFATEQRRFFFFFAAFLVAAAAAAAIELKLIFAEIFRFRFSNTRTFLAAPKTGRTTWAHLITLFGGWGGRRQLLRLHLQPASVAHRLSSRATCFCSSSPSRTEFQWQQSSTAKKEAYSAKNSLCEKKQKSVHGGSTFCQKSLIEKQSAAKREKKTL